MKHNIFLSLVALASFIFAACSPDEYDGADQSQLPRLADYADAFTVTVNQNTNWAHFDFDPSVSGVTPVWIINGTRYSAAFSDSAYYQNAGDYTVDCQVKNRNGISVDKITKTFHVDHSR